MHGYGSQAMSICGKRATILLNLRPNMMGSGKVQTKGRQITGGGSAMLLRKAMAIAVSIPVST